MQYKEVPVEILWPDASIKPVGISSSFQFLSNSRMEFKPN